MEPLLKLSSRDCTARPVRACQSACPSVCPSVSLSVSQFVCLSVSQKGLTSSQSNGTINIPACARERGDKGESTAFFLPFFPSLFLSYGVYFSFFPEPFSQADWHLLNDHSDHSLQRAGNYFQSCLSTHRPSLIKTSFITPAYG